MNHKIKSQTTYKQGDSKGIIAQMEKFKYHSQQSSVYLHSSDSLHRLKRKSNSRKLIRLSFPWRKWTGQIALKNLKALPAIAEKQWNLH